MITVDITAPGTSNAASHGLSTGTIASGTVINSYYVHFDQIGSAITSLSGSLTFSDDILGLIVLSDSLAATNVNPGRGMTAYDSLPIDFVVEDSVTLSEDRRTVSFNLTITGGADNMRIITAVPEPSVAGMIIMMTCAFCRRRKFDIVT